MRYNTQNSITVVDAEVAELDATRAVHDMLKPLGCDAQTRVLSGVKRTSTQQGARRCRAHLLGVRRRLAAFSRSACWTAHLSTSELTRFCSSSFSLGDLGLGACADLNSLLKFNPRKKSLNPSTIVKSSRACSRKRFVNSSFVSFG